MFTLALFGGVLVVCLLVSALFLRLGVKWMKLPRPGFVRSVMVFGCQIIVGLVILACVTMVLASPKLRDASMLILVAQVACGLALPVLIKIWHGGSVGRVLVAWLVSCLGGAITAPFVYFAVKPYMLEFFAITSNSMSPNFRAAWTTGVCPQCGRSFIIAAPDPDSRDQVARFRLGLDFPAVCESCYYFDRVPVPDQSPHTADRVACNKLKQPSRWDVICYRPPSHPELVYAKRVLGLPGEALFIRDSAVWINGEKQAPPSALGPIRYTIPEELLNFPGIGDQPKRRWGDPADPVKLGRDEYFLLGDNTNSSLDSRKEGPINKADILGVVDVIYWPIERMRILP
jgi:signal peptidase I